MLTKVTLLPSLLVCFSGYFFQVASRYQNVSIQDFIGAKDDGGGGDRLTAVAARHGRLQSDHHQRQTNTQIFIVLLPNSVIALKEKTILQ